MLTMRLWTNANYDLNATITILVDDDIVVYYRRSSKDCVVDGWLGYPVGGTQKQTCFMDLKEIVNHTRDAINVKIGIYFDGRGRLIRFLVSANQKYIYCSETPRYKFFTSVRSLSNFSVEKKALTCFLRL